MVVRAVVTVARVVVMVDSCFIIEMKRQSNYGLKQQFSRKF